MTGVVWLAVWLIAAALTFAAGTVLLVAVGLAWSMQEDRQGGCRGGGCGRSPRPQGGATARWQEGSGYRVIPQEDEKR